MEPIEKRPNTGPGWSLAEERRLGDHLQKVIDEGAPTPTPEDLDAAQIAAAAMEMRPGYEPGDDA